MELIINIHDGARKGGQTIKWFESRLRCGADIIAIRIKEVQRPPDTDVGE
jgi:hypothetical protein